VEPFGVFQDVSERMRADEAIRLRERLLNGIFEILPIGLWIADESGKFLRGNAAAVQSGLAAEKASLTSARERHVGRFRNTRDGR
jgi:hypothetical protein